MFKSTVIKRVFLKKSLGKFVWYFFPVNEEFIIKIFVLMVIFIKNKKKLLSNNSHKDFNDHNSIMLILVAVNVFRYTGKPSEL